MILVSFKEYVAFLQSENLPRDSVPCTRVPCIVQHLAGSIVKAKVEVVDLSAYKWNEKYGLSNFRKSTNKYWIRGAERL